MSKNNKLAVTGATGKKSGGHFYQLLIENIDTVKSIYSGGVNVLTRSELQMENTFFTNYIGNLNDYTFVSNALKDVDTVVHIASIYYSLNIVKAAIANDVRRLILVHTTGIYSKYKSAGKEYLKIESIINELCIEKKIRLTILRPTMIYGNTYDNNVMVFVKMIDKLPIMPLVNNGNYYLQPVYYKDLGRAYYNVLFNSNTENKEYILSGGEKIKLKKMFDMIGEQLGKRVKYISVPFWIAYPGSIILYFLSFTKYDFREKVQRLCEDRAFDHTEATEDFGYEPIDFSKGAKLEVEAYLRGKKI